MYKKIMGMGVWTEKDTAITNPMANSSRPNMQTLEYVTSISSHELKNACSMRM